MSVIPLVMPAADLIGHSDDRTHILVMEQRFHHVGTRHSVSLYSELIQRPYDEQIIRHRIDNTIALSGKHSIRENSSA